MNNYTVYLIINTYNGKKYVGCTSLNVDRRWQNGNGYRHNKEFFNDIKEYGWENFIHLILYSGLNKERAEYIETKLIKYFDSVDNGYNISYGVSTKGLKGKNNPNYGKHHTEEWNNKISEGMRGGKHTEETKKKMSKTRKNKHHTEEWNNKIGKAHEKKVICITTGKIFNSIKEAAEFYDTHPQHISKCCKGKKYKSAGKFNGIKLVWKYLDDYLKENNNH